MEAGNAKPGRPWHGRLRVGEAIDEAPHTRTLRLVSPDGGPLPFEFLPGQFVVVGATRDGKRVNRAYTISSAPTHRDHADITVARAEHGKLSPWLTDEVRVGDEIDVIGPSGRFVFTGEEADSVLMLAGGVGVAPFMSEARALVERDWPGDIRLMVSYRTPAEYLFRHDLEEMAATRPRFHLFVTMTRAAEGEWDGRRGRIDRRAIEEFVPDPPSRMCLLCGSKPFVEELTTTLRELGVPEERVRSEAF